MPKDKNGNFWINRYECQIQGVDFVFEYTDDIRQQAAEIAAHIYELAQEAKKYQEGDEELKIINKKVLNLTKQEIDKILGAGSCDKIANAAGEELSLNTTTGILNYLGGIVQTNW